MWAAALVLLALAAALARSQLLQTDEAVMQALADTVAAWQNATSSAACRAGAQGIDWSLNFPACGNGTQGSNWRGIACDAGARVTEIRLAGCGLDGTLPAELPQMPRLATLDLSRNVLAGGIPPSWTAPGAFPSLDSLNLADNQLTGGLSDFTMAAVGFMAATSFNVSGNAFDVGGIPAAWYSRTLAAMDLSRNGVSGQLPPEWGLPRAVLGTTYRSALPALASLHVEGNNLSGPADPWPGGGAAVFAPGFVATTSPGNPLLERGPPPPALAPAPAAAPESGTVAALMAQKDAISNWELFSGNNSFRGWNSELPVCNWTGVACAGGAVVQLAWACDEAGAPEVRGQCGARAEGFLVAQLANISSLRSLVLSSQNLSGTLPLAWGRAGAFVSLQQMSLNNNQLSGTLPVGWGAAAALPALLELNLYRNQLTGTLPPEWSDGFRLLNLMDLRDCLLTGTLPEAWGASPDSVPALEQLWINANNLTGEVPDAWGNATAFPSLRQLGLDDNPYLCGTVPPNLVEPVCLSGATQCADSDEVACSSEFASPPELDLEPAPLVAGSSGGGLAAGAVAGIAIGAVAACTLACVALLAWRRWRQRGRQRLGGVEAGSKWAGGQGEGSPAAAAAPSDGDPFAAAQPSPASPLAAVLPPGVAACPGKPTSAAGAASDGACTPPSNSEAAAPRLSMDEGATRHEVGDGLDGDPVLTYVHSVLASRPSQPARVQAGPRTGLAATHILAAAAGSTSGGRERLSADMAMWAVPWEELQLEKLIGRGSFGFVYAARWHETMVAAKLLLRSDEEEAAGGLELPGDIMKRLQEEAAVLARMRHPNIVSFMGLCNMPPCIVTEYCSRGSLYDVLRRARRDASLAAQLTWHQRLRMAADAATGLLYLHSRSPPIIHRDVKSPNLLVDESWRLKVADFNLSKILESEAAAHSTSLGAGNPIWQAPEVLEGQQATAAADVYAFGLVLLELCTWDVPWRLPPLVVMRRVVSGERPEVPARAALPGPDRPPAEDWEAYCQLMRECWAHEPAGRPDLSAVVPRLVELLHLPDPPDTALSMLSSGFSTAPS